MCPLDPQVVEKMNEMVGNGLDYRVCAHGKHLQLDREGIAAWTQFSPVLGCLKGAASRPTTGRPLTQPVRRIGLTSAAAIRANAAPVESGDSANGSFLSAALGKIFREAIRCVNLVVA